MTCILYFTQVERLEVACPFQYLHISTSAYYSDVTGKFPINSSILIDGAKTSIVMNVTGLPARQQYYSNFSIVDQDGATINTGVEISFSEQNKVFMFC